MARADSGQALRVVKDTGRPLSASETIGRNLMRIADQLPAFYAVGILSTLLTAQNKRLGDLVAGLIEVGRVALADAAGLAPSTRS